MGVAMGVETLKNIASTFMKAFSGFSGASEILAWIGVAILLLLAAIYGAIAFWKGLRAIAYMKVRHFVFMLVGIAVSFILIAAILP